MVLQADALPSEPPGKPNSIIHIAKYLKCKWIKSINQKTDWLGRWKLVHVCTSSYHVTLFNPPECMQFFYIVRLIMLPFTFCLAIDCENWLTYFITVIIYFSLNTIASWLVNRKIIEFCTAKTFKRKTYNRFLFFLYMSSFYFFTPPPLLFF